MFGSWSHRLSPALGVLLVLGGCGRGPAAPAGPDAVSEDGPRCVVQAEGLTAYRWDGGPWTTVFCRSQTLELAPGAARQDSQTRLLLALDEGRGSEVHDAVRGGACGTVPPGRFVPGRFGTALLVVEGDPGLELPASLFENPPASVSFWFQGELPDRETLLLDAPPIHLSWTAEARVRATIDGSTGPVRLRSDPLRPVGAWHRVVVALDAPELPQVRLIVDDQVVSASWYPDPALLAVDGRLGAPRGGNATAALRVDDLAVVGHSVPSQEALEAYRGPERAGLHRIGLRTLDSVLERELWWPVLGERLLAGAELSRGALEFLRPAGGGLRRTEAHCKRLEVGPGPLARTSHAVVGLGDGRVLVFGGEVRDTHGPAWKDADDTWMLDVRERRWSRVRSDAAPPPLAGQPAAYSPDHRIVLLAGGARSDRERPQVYDGTWELDLDSLQWREVPSGRLPTPTSESALVYHAGIRRFVLFPRGARFVALYDPAGGKWTALPSFRAVDAEGRRIDYAWPASPAAAYSPETDEVVVFGGMASTAGQRRALTTTALFDLRRNRLTVLDLEGPVGRERAGFSYDERRRSFALFGGLDGEHRPFGDLWDYDPFERRWTPLDYGGDGSPRGGFCGMAYDPDLDRHFLIHGQDEEGTRAEVLELRIDPEVPATATYTFDVRRVAPASGLWALQDGDSLSAMVRFGDSRGRWGPWLAPGEALEASPRALLCQVRLVWLSGNGATLGGLGFGEPPVPVAGERVVRWPLELIVP